MYCGHVGGMESISHWMVRPTASSQIAREHLHIVSYAPLHVCTPAAGSCCRQIVELNPDGTPKDPQTKEQKKEDPKDLRNAAKAADWGQMRMLLRRMPYAQINSGASTEEGDEDEKGAKQAQLTQLSERRALLLCVSSV